ncbi:MAG: serine protease [Patescibacteria group bacterium]
MDYSELIKKIKPSIAIVFSTKGNKVIGKGTGFIFAKKGILVTCNHVVKEHDANFFIKFSDNDAIINSKIVIRDEEHDLALLQFTDETRQPLLIAKADTVKEGMPVVFSGYPLTLSDLTTHQGILSAIIKDATGIITYLIDGTVNSGNSGCPLMTQNGEVIGVVNAKRREQSDLLRNVEEMQTGALSLYGVDLVKIYQALIENVQLGIGYAIPASYIPKHHSPEIVLPYGEKNNESIKK